MIEYIFFASLFFMFFTYAGYPISLYIIYLFKKSIVEAEKQNENVTIIITAHNEEKSIKYKIENILSVLYPKEKLQIIVVSDGSNDRTNEIIGNYLNKGIEFLSIAERGGKENAQKEAIKIAKGDILIFTDVGTLLDPEGIERIVSNFADSSIGCVSGEDRIIGIEGKPSGEGLYVRYEMWLRRLESQVFSVVGMSGSFFAARKAVCQDFSSYLDSDFRTLLNSVKCGMRGVSDPKAIGYYREISDQRLEFDRKVRTVLRGITVFFNSLEYLNIFKYGIFSYQYFCHKLLRWLVPLFLIIAFLSITILSVSSWIYLVIAIMMVGIIIIVLLERLRMLYNVPGFLKIPIFFITVNYSILIAWYKFFKRERIITWTPTVRS